MVNSDQQILTIAIPSYNRASKLDRQIEWAVNSINDRWDIFELLVSDNNSTDDTALICEKWVSKTNNRIRIVKQKRNLGLIGNYTFCIENAKGKYFWGVGDDDPIYPQALDTILSNLQKYQSVGLIHLNHACVSSINGEVVHPYFYSFTEDKYAEDGGGLFSSCINNQHYGGFMWITANIMETKIARAGTESWLKGTRNIAFALYLPGFAAAKKPFLFIAETLCVCMYHNTSWERQLLWVNYVGVPNIFMRLTKIGYPYDFVQKNLMKIFSNLGRKNLINYLFKGNKFSFDLLKTYVRFKLNLY